MTDQDDRSAHAIAGDITTVVAFVSFAIIYVNLLIAADILPVLTETIPDNLRPVKMAMVVALFSPTLLAGTLISEFVARYARHVFRTPPSGTFAVMKMIYQLGMFVGIVSFVLVISFFVAYQSHSYLSEIAPGVSSALRSVLGRS